MSLSSADSLERIVKFVAASGAIAAEDALLAAETATLRAAGAALRGRAEDLARDLVTTVKRNNDDGGGGTSGGGDGDGDGGLPDGQRAADEDAASSMETNAVATVQVTCNAGPSAIRLAFTSRTGDAKVAVSELFQGSATAFAMASAVTSRASPWSTWRVHAATMAGAGGYKV